MVSYVAAMNALRERAHAATAACAAHERVVRRVVARMHQRVTVWGWETLVDWVAARGAQRSTLALALGQMRNRCAAAAFNGWLSFVELRASARETVRGAMGRWRNRAALGAFATWRAATGEALRQRAIAHTTRAASLAAASACIRRWQRRLLNRAFEGLDGNVKMLRACRRALKRVARSMLRKAWSVFQRASRGALCVAQRVTVTERARADRIKRVILSCRHRVYVARL